MTNFGVVFPQTEFGSDPAAIRDYAQSAEGLGFSHIIAYDHILGANPDRPGGWEGVYTYQHSFQEPFVLFAFMAGLTQRIGFTTSIIILPQRQTALVAKQVATLDHLSGGRLRLGVGLGWNEIEYRALGQDFHTRNKRFEEQIYLLRRLWTEPLVNFTGQWDTIPDAGINPLPLQQPVPIWFGGHAKAVLRRAAHLADGWMPNYRKPEEARPALELLKHYLREAGREQSSFGIEARIAFGSGDPEIWHKLIQSWQADGATHISFNTMGSGFQSPGAHLSALQKIAASIGLH
jgi:probable F420-dependent oxidoreductase